MTEAEWLACTDPGPMLAFLRGKASERKLRLFAVACYRRVPGLAGLPEIAVAERVAEGLATENELADARDESARCDVQWVGQFSYAPPPEEILLPLGAGVAVTASPATDAAEAASAKAVLFAGDGERQGQAALVRDIFGNPFRPVAVDRSWATPTVVALAQAASSERVMPSAHLDPAQLAILADALEDAGCTDQAMLGHCRSEGPHVRGCWVVDLLLGKS
jgi:hypothetical protein